MPDLHLRHGLTIPEARLRDMMWGPPQITEPWFARLDQIVADACSRWQVTLTDELPRHSINLVLFGASPFFGDVVIKVAPPLRDVAAEIAALRHAHPGLVLDADPKLAGVLLRRLRPGRTLRDELAAGGIDDARATEILADQIAAYWRPAPADPALHPLRDWLRSLFNHRNQPIAGLDARRVQLACALADDLLAHPTGTYLLHGDLHHDNVLLDDDTNPHWVTIDPKGLVGDPGFDITAAMMNPVGFHTWPDVAAVTDRRLDQYSERLGLDRTRLWQWTFVFTQLSDLWNLEVFADATPRCQPIADALLTFPEGRGLL